MASDIVIACCHLDGEGSDQWHWHSWGLATLSPGEVLWLKSKQKFLLLAWCPALLLAGAFGWLWGQAEEGGSFQLVLLQACCSKEGKPAGSGQICQTSCHINLRASLQGRMCVSSLCAPATAAAPELLVLGHRWSQTRGWWW